MFLSLPNRSCYRSTMRVAFLLASSPFIVAILAASSSNSLRRRSQDHMCSIIEPLGILQLPFRPGYLAAGDFNGEESLLVSSFFNIELNPNPSPPQPPFRVFKRDLVAQVLGLEGIEQDDFSFTSTSIQELTDFDPASDQMPKTVWPNELIKAPEGVFPFEALVSAQGFLSPAARFPGRLVAIDMGTMKEYVISLSSQLPTGFDSSNPLDPYNSPRFYHTAVFYDVNGDGYKDIITVRSGLRVGPQFYPPFSELVWFQNPGASLDPKVEWTETILYGGPLVGFQGPDIDVLMHDFDGDGVPEFVATHFFAGSADTGKITLYGAPAGGSWSQVNALDPQAPKVRTKDLVIE